MNTDPHAPVQLSDERERGDALRLQVLAALDAGQTYREISSQLGCSLGYISKLAQSIADIERGAVAKLMTIKALPALDLWWQAAESAAKQGKHAAAKDWLLHARALDPVAAEQAAGAKVAIIIGTPGAPVDLPSLQVIDSTDVSSDSVETE